MGRICWISYAIGCVLNRLENATGAFSGSQRRSNPLITKFHPSLYSYTFVTQYLYSTMSNIDHNRPQYAGYRCLSHILYRFG